MIEMVVGFVFNGCLGVTSKVLLIEKKRPEWQKGKINGIGGKIESMESPGHAMIREFKEETTYTINNFKNFAIINGSGWKVYFYHAISVPFLILPEPNPTDEKIIIADINNLPKNVMPNLRWLIPMALDQDLIKPVIIYDKSKWEGLKKLIVWED